MNSIWYILYRKSEKENDQNETVKETGLWNRLLPAYRSTCLAFGGKWLPVVGGPVFAILIGMCLALILKEQPALEPGVKYTSKKILQYAVILLGFGMNLTDILEKGKQSLPIILTTITTALVIAFVMYKVLKMDSKISTLVGVGSCICGGSAIAATAPVIDADDEEDCPSDFRDLSF